MICSNRWLGFALLAACLSAQAQRPVVGSSMTLESTRSRAGSTELVTPLYPQPETGRESAAELHAATRAIQAKGQPACAFSKADIAQLADPQSAYVFKVMDLRDVARETRFTNGQSRSETNVWARVVNPHKPQCGGWLPMGPVGQAEPAQAPAAAAPAPAGARAALGPAQGLAPGQPPGFFCPTGWQPNPSGSLMTGGGFKCFAGTALTIPAGFRCPAGMELQDHSATGLLVCKAR